MQVASFSLAQVHRGDGSSHETPRTRILIVGVGGLGCPAALALKGYDVTLVDFDRVELSNLHRQILFHTEDIGRSKAKVAGERLGMRFLELKVSPDNAHALFEQHDVVIDGTDGVRQKLMLNDVAVATGVPLVYGGVLKASGQAMVIQPGGACLRCLFEESLEGPSCAQAGVLGTVAGVVGQRQAELSLSLEPGLHVFDSRRIEFRVLPIARAADCPVCPVSIDVTQEVCPMTYVRVKLATEKLQKGRLLEVWLQGSEPLRNVPRSAREEGHEVLSLRSFHGRSRLLLSVGSCVFHPSWGVFKNKSDSDSNFRQLPFLTLG